MRATSDASGAAADSKKFLGTPIVRNLISQPKHVHDFEGIRLRNRTNSSLYIIKIKIHSSCEIEDFVETHLCKLCVILRSRALRVVCPH